MISGSLKQELHPNHKERLSFGRVFLFLHVHLQPPPLPGVFTSVCTTFWRAVFSHYQAILDTPNSMFDDDHIPIKIYQNRKMAEAETPKYTNVYQKYLKYAQKICISWSHLSYLLQ